MNIAHRSDKIRDEAGPLAWETRRPPVTFRAVGGETGVKKSTQQTQASLLRNLDVKERNGEGSRRELRIKHDYSGAGGRLRG